MPSPGERVRRRARELRAWLELGTASLEEAEEIFTDAKLRSRLADPLSFYETAAGGGEPLPAEAVALATKAASHIGISQAVAEDLLRLLAEDRLSGLPVLHAAGIFEVLELNSAGLYAELAQLLHAEQCEALLALAAILRGAHDDSHAFGAQCRELAQKLLSDGLEKTLWDTYIKVAGCPRFSSAPEHAEVERVVKEGLSLQLCVLECLILAKYDSQINRSDPEQICRMTEEFFRQRFLGSLPKAAHQHHWLLGDSEICGRAQCVGDLCLTLLLEAFCLEEVAEQPTQAVARHVLLASPEHVKHLQQLIEGSWLDICHHAAHPKEATPALVHCGRAVSIAALGWAVLLGSMPESYRETHGFGFQRLMSSAVFQSRHLLRDAAGSIQARAFLMLDGPNALHTAPRAVFRGLVAAASSAFRLDVSGPMAAAHAALSKLASIAYEGDAGACVEFWRSDYEKREGSFHVLHSWLLSFPRHLPRLLEILGGLASGSGALFVVELLQAPLNTLQLPYRLLRHLTDFEESPSSSSRPPSGARIVLRGGAYVEELALRLMGLELPEWYVSSSLVLPAGSQGLLSDRPQDGSHSSSHSHLVRWALPGPGVSIWRISLAAWDAVLLGRKNGVTTPEGQELLGDLTRCFSNVLIENSSSLESFLKDLPDEKPSSAGLVARLLATFFALARSSDESARPLLCRLLLALRSACAAPGAAVALLRLLEGEPTAFYASGNVADFVNVLSGLADAEREAGAYPITCAALELVRALLEASPVELLVLPWAVHQSLGLPTFAQPGPEGPLVVPRAEEVLGPLLDFTFSTFSRCSFWPCRALSERFAVAERCLGVAGALLPALEVFNWPEAACLATKDNDLGRSLAGLRSLQLRLLRSFGEVAFVQNLLQCILCDIVYGPAPADASMGRPFVGFRSPALQVHTAAPTPGDGSTLTTLEPSSGPSLISASLRILHRLLGLVLGPAGFAPHYQPLAEHLLELTAVRESLGPLPPTRTTAEGTPTCRADLVQSLYAHICCTETAVAESAAECLVSLSALWCRADMRHAQLDGAANASGRARLLASLSVPSASPTEEASKAVSLSTHLSKRLSSVLGNSELPRSFRCAVADLARSALATQPGLLAEPASFVKSAGQALAGLVAEATPLKDHADAKRLCFVCLALLDDLAASDESLLASNFESTLEFKPAVGSSKSYPSTWQLLMKVFSDGLRPWLSKRSPWSPPRETRDHEAPLASLAGAALLRLVERGCAKAQASASTMHEDLLALLRELLSPQTLDLLHPVGAKEASGERSASASATAPPAPGPRPELSREVSFAAGSKVVVTATGVSADFELLQQPYGERSPEGEGCQDRFLSLLGQLELQKEILAPQTSAACAAATGALAANQWLASNGGSAGAVSQDLAAQLEAKGVGSVPSCFRCWGQLCEIACGVALDVPPPAAGRYKRRATLPQERIGCFGSRGNASLVHCGSDIVDGYAVAAMLVPFHEQSVRFAAAVSAAQGFAREGGGCSGPDDPVLQALRALMADLGYVSSSQAATAAAAPLALEAFDDLLVTTARLSSPGSKAAAQVEGILPPIAWGLTYQLHQSMQKMGQLMENPRSFASLLALTTQTFALQPQGSALSSSSKAFGTFTARLDSAGFPADRSGYLKEMLTQETTAGLALVSQLMVALRTSTAKAQGSLPPRAAALLASAGFLSAGAEAHAGVLGNSGETGSAFAEVALQVLSLLLQLVPALGRAPMGAGRSSLQAVPLLMGLLEVLGQLLNNFAVVEKVRERSRQSQAVAAAAQRRAAAAPQEPSVDTSSDPVPGWPARAPVSAPGTASVQVLQRPEDAAVREASETQAEKLDEVLRSGFLSLVLALVERTLHALRARGGDQRPPQEAVLSHILSSSFCVFAPGPSRIGAAPPRTDVGQAAWNRASEAAQACRLDATVSVLMRVAQTASGASLLVEHRIFQLLAFCPLLRQFVLANESSYVVPSNALDTAPPLADGQRRSVMAAWRRPVHSSWCRVLLLVATILSSVVAPSGAEHFLQVYKERFCFVFQTNLQSGRLAALEEASLMARVLAFLSTSCGLAQSLATDASLRAMIFVMNSCLSERSSPSEVFLPVSAEERAGAMVQQLAADGESTTAQVPSIFHQRVEYLGLEVLRSLLLALLRISSSPKWALGRAQVANVSPAPKSIHGWPTAYQSVFGLQDAGGSAAFAAADTDVIRFWAALMDVSLEAGRKALELLETLQGTRQELNRLLISSCAPPGDAGDGGDDTWLPLSLALVGIGEQSTAEGSDDAKGFSPSNLAMGLTPMSAPLSPTNRATSPLLGPSQTRSGPRVNRSRAMRFKYAARKPYASIGGQFPTAAPEGVTLGELRDMAGSIVELSSTLLCRFCQVAKSDSSGLSQASPGVAVLHGLLSFLHEVLDSTESGPTALGERTVEFLSAVRSRAEMQLRNEEVTAFQHSGTQLNPVFDGDAWVLGEA